MPATTHRVVCPDFTQELPDLATAQRHLSGVEAAGKCRQIHTIEVRDGNEWVPLHIARAREILAAPMQAPITTPDGPVVKVAGSWSAEAGERAETTAGKAGDDPAAYLAALGPHEEATLSSDGGQVQAGAWCACGVVDSAAMVRYERWTAAGRVAHGYVHAVCRRLTQTG